MYEPIEKRRALRAESDNRQIVSAESEIEVYESIRNTLASARITSINAINTAMVIAYWEIGRQINEAIGDRAKYGKQLLKYLSSRLTAEFGKGFDESNLRNIRKFYSTFPIRDALRHELTWTHYRMLMRVDEPKRREFYLTECAESSCTPR